MPFKEGIGRAREEARKVILVISIWQDHMMDVGELHLGVCILVLVHQNLIKLLSAHKNKKSIFYSDVHKK